MTLEEDEGIGPALPASGHQAPAKTRAQRALARCAEIATAIPIIILLLPVYALIQIYAAAVGIHRILRGIHRRIPSVCIPDACGPSQNLARGPTLLQKSRTNST